MKRRDFLQLIGKSSLLAIPYNGLLDKPEMMHLTILHTNDVHSRIEPFPMDGSSLQGQGGAARRAAMIAQIRREEKNVLLLDAGDIFQGTPYFNFFGGELEFKLMSSMKYDASTFGNHDFDTGIEGLHKQLPHAQFPFVNSNYDLSDTLLNGKAKPYMTIKKGGIKVGILGLGIDLQGLVSANMIKGLTYQDPIAQANKYAAILRHDEKCDYVICLSHLGYSYAYNKVSDVVLAKNTKEIDLIIGGHTHTFLEKPESVKNAAGKETLINQVGWAGVVLGRIDVHFELNKKNKCVTCKNEPVK